MARRVTCLLLSLVSDIRTHRVQSSENKFIVLRRLSRLVFHLFSFFSFPSRFFFFFFPLSFLSSQVVDRHSPRFASRLYWKILTLSRSVQRAKKRRTMENRGETVERRGEGDLFQRLAWLYKLLWTERSPAYQDGLKQLWNSWLGERSSLWLIFRVLFRACSTMLFISIIES